MSATALLKRIPLTARRVAYVGDHAEAFWTAYVARNPHAVWTQDDEAVDLLVVADAEGWSSREVADRARTLEPGGYLVARSRTGASLSAILEALGERDFRVARLQLLIDADDHFNDQGLGHSTADLAALVDRDLLLIAQRRDETVNHAPPIAVQIAAFAPTLLDIRTRLPAHALRADPELTVAYGGALTQFLDLPVDAPKILILQRPRQSKTELWRTATAEALRRGWLVVLEIDDHPALLAAVSGGKPQAEDWARLSYVHAIQTSTERLARTFRKYNPEVRVFGNSLFELPPRLTEAQPRRVFYGAVSRGPFAARVAASLTRVTEELPDTVYEVVGDRAVFEAIPTANKTYHDYLPYDRYLELMGACAVSLSPLEGRPREDTKSDAKFLDAAARGVVTLASPTVYAETIVHGQTGLIAPRLKDWAPMLVGVLRDEAARQAMAGQAYDYVRGHRMFAHQALARREWYQDLWRRRDVLTSGVVSRLPGLAEVLANA